MLGLDPLAHYVEGPPEAVTAFVLCLDAINFGSGWWPTVRKRHGRSGYLTVAGCLADRFRARKPWTANELADVGSEGIAEVLGQDPAHELVRLFAAALRDLSGHVRTDADGRFERVVEQAEGSAVALATRLSGWHCFADTAPTTSCRCRSSSARAAVRADLQAAEVGRFADLHRLIAFADNLVPHVLALDGVLVLDADLAGRIAAGELLVHDSPEEVELCACALHAVELLAAACAHRLSPAQIDMVLWARGQDPRSRARPRHGRAAPPTEPTDRTWSTDGNGVRVLPGHGLACYDGCGPRVEAPPVQVRSSRPAGPAGAPVTGGCVVGGDASSTSMWICGRDRPSAAMRRTGPVAAVRPRR